MTRFKCIAIIGFSGSGKTATARALAERLGWDFIDLDLELERQFGMTIPEVFETKGESQFRAAERMALVDALQRNSAVIATGGGAAVDESVWSNSLLGDDETLTVTLDAKPETILARLSEQHSQEGSAVARPMLAGNDPLTRITDLKQRRQSAYDRSKIILIVDSINPDQVAHTIESLLGSNEINQEPSIRLDAPSGYSEIFISKGAAGHVGSLARSRWPNSSKVWVVSDENVAKHHGQATCAALSGANFETRLIEVPPGEASKSLSTAGQLYDHLLNDGIERADILVALGGGVIGDLAGFVAATVLRGIGLIQAPTSLLAMVDSSVGGKTGINHAAGKNLIGSFYQPPLVVIDPDLLATLPPRELSQGWAEIVKHALIQVSTPGGEAGDLERYLERNCAQLRSLSDPSLTYLIRRNVELKARVVEADERESGIRSYLNFGHTFGHAIEAADYRYLHGEAIALGIRAAARLSRNMGSVTQQKVDEIDSLLDRFGLPRTGVFETTRVVELLGSDKKRSRGRLRWVLLRQSGGVEIRDDVSMDQAASALAEIQA